MMLLLRILHIVVGTFWAGTVIFIALFLMPSARAVGPAAGPMMAQLAQVRRMSQWLLVSGGVTVLAGLVLLWRVSGGFDPVWMGSGTGITFSTGGLLAIVALTLGLTQNSPTAKKLGALTARRAAAGGGPPPPEEAAEMQRLQAKLGRLTFIAAVLLAGATLCMAIARYVV